jgi:hypothetical protein
MFNQTRLLSFSAFSITAALLFASVTDAQARGRMHSGTISGSGGRSAQFGSSVQAGGGNRSATRSIQGSEGRGVTHDVNRTYDPTTQSIDRTATTTTNSGASLTHTGSTTNEGNGSFSHQSSTTGPQGKTTSTTGSTSVYAGGASHTSTTTGPNGQQVTVDSSTTVEH